MELKDEQVLAVSQMQTYIKDNLECSISLYDLSRSAGYSPCYSARLFKQYTGYPPFEYIRMLRLSKAALRMRDIDCKVIDVAFDFVFDSHEGFTRAFTKEFGINPKQYRTHKPPIKLFLPYPVKDYYAYLKKGRLDMNGEIKKASNEVKKSITVFTQVIEKPKRKLILKRGLKADEYFAYCEEVGCDVWGILSSVHEALYEPMGMWLPKSMIPVGTSEYVQGVEVGLSSKVCKLGFPIPI